MKLPHPANLSFLSFVLVTGCARTVVGSGGASASSTSTTSTSSKTSTTTSTGSAMVVCGTEMCGPGAFCDDTSGGCGKGPASALHCVVKGNVCSDGQFVCGCDGMVYMSEGCATLAGVGVDATNKCPPPPTGFFCGGTACELAGSYCQEIAHPDQPGVATTYGCMPLPAACNGKASCACLDNCGSGPQPPMCTIDAAGNATQHCATG